MVSHKWWLNVTDHRDWFIQNKKKYGSLRYMYKRMILFMILWYIEISIAVYLDSSILLLSFPLIMTAYCILMFYCFCQMPQIYDVYKIRKEINILTIMFVVTTIYSVFVRNVHIQSQVVLYINSYIGMLINAATNTLMILWPYYDKTLHGSQIWSDNNNENDNTTTRTSTVKTYTDWKLYINSCEDDTKFNIFMKFLMREFAVENLCFVLEAVQFKQQLIQNFEEYFVGDRRVFVNYDEIGWFIKLPKGLPRSAILDEYKGNFTEQLNHIYNKYISNDAKMQVNASGDAYKFFADQLVVLSNTEFNREVAIKDVDYREFKLPKFTVFVCVFMFFCCVVSLICIQHLNLMCKDLEFRISS